MEHFQQNAAAMAVPTRVSSLDKRTIRCKERSTTRTCVKSKPVKFGIRFYSIVGWSLCYLHSIFDNGSENGSEKSPVTRYVSVFWELRRSVEYSINGSIVAKGSASALLSGAQAASRTKVHPSLQHGLPLVMDNFYKRHRLARQMNALCDGEVFVMDTVRLNGIDAINRPAVSDAVKSIKSAERGSWMLCEALNFEAERNGAPTVATKSRLIVSKNHSFVTLYINYLSNAPSQRTEELSAHTISSVHGATNMPR